MKANEVKRGQVMKLDGDAWNVVGIEHITPGNKRAIYQMKLKNLNKGNVIERRFAPWDAVEVAYLESREMQYLYRDGAGLCFMDNETYEQLVLPEALVGEDEQYLKLNSNVKVQFLDGEPMGLGLPASVVLEVTETEPGVKGDTVSNVFKPSRLETGLVVNVPLHIKQGEKVRVNTRTGEFLERANE